MSNPSEADPQEEVYHAVNADGYDISYEALFGCLANWESIRNEQHLRTLVDSQDQAMQLMLLNKIKVDGNDAVLAVPQDQPAEELQVLQHALGNFIELMNEPNSADRSHNPEQADRNILVAQKMLSEISSMTEVDVQHVQESGERPRG